MQVTHQNENEREDSRGAGAIDFDICIEEISRRLEEKCTGRSGVERLEISVGRRFISSIEEGVWKMK